MIKNPSHLQTVFFIEDCEIKSGKITYQFEAEDKCPPAVEISNWYHRYTTEIYSTKEETQNALPKEISKSLKNLNKRIKDLSKKREKLASRLAKILKK